MFLKFCNILSKTSVLESLFNKVAERQVCNYIKKWLQHRCFPVNIAKFLKTAFLFNTSSGWFYRCSIKKLFPKILQTSAELIVIGVLFNQDAGLELAPLSKYRVFCCEFCEIFQSNIMQNNGCSWATSGVAGNKCSRN